MIIETTIETVNKAINTWLGSSTTPITCEKLMENFNLSLACSKQCLAKYVYDSKVAGKDEFVTIYKVEGVQTGNEYDCKFFKYRQFLYVISNIRR
jgi:hypothetical protein